LYSICFEAIAILIFEFPSVEVNSDEIVHPEEETAERWAKNFA
jgi:hypothetical protein